jgi:hypothetical protein
MVAAHVSESMDGMKIAYPALPLALGLFPAQSQQVPPKPTSTTFLLDRATGKIWKYQGPFQYKTAEGKDTAGQKACIPIEVRQPRN